MIKKDRSGADLTIGDRVIYTPPPHISRTPLTATVVAFHSGGWARLKLDWEQVPDRHLIATGMLVKPTTLTKIH